MGKHITDRGICHRAAELVRAHGPVQKEFARLGLSRKAIYSWESGDCPPSIYALQAMAYAGYDVHYILTGRKLAKNSAIDEPVETP